MGRMTLDRHRVAADFAAAVNMGADELDAWLATPESRGVGFRRDGGESVGHASGRRIVRLLRDGPEGDDDYRHMRKTIGFVRRHRAQEPANMVTSRWRYSLMNWGHDPLRG
jgi:hypothetical protein